MSQLPVEGFWCSCLFSVPAWIFPARPRGSIPCAPAQEHRSGGELFQHWWLNSTCSKSSGNFPVELRGLTQPGPIHHLWDSKIIQNSETGSSLVINDGAKRKNMWMEFCCLCFMGETSPCTWYIVHLFRYFMCNKITAVSSGVGSFPIDKPNLLGFLLLWSLLLLLKQIKYPTFYIQ